MNCNQQTNCERIVYIYHQKVFITQSFIIINVYKYANNVCLLIYNLIDVKIIYNFHINITYSYISITICLFHNYLQMALMSKLLGNLDNKVFFT